MYSKYTYFITLILIFVACREEPTPTYNDEFLYIGDSGYFNYIDVYEPDKLFVTSAYYDQFTYAQNGYLIFDRYGYLLEVNGTGNAESILRSTQKFHHMYYTLYGSQSQQGQFILGQLNNFNLEMSASSSMNQYEWMDFYFADESTLFLLGETRGNESDIVIAKLHVTISDYEIADITTFSIPDIQAAKKVLPLSNNQYLIIYEDNQNGFQNRNIAFIVIDSSLNTVAESKLELAGYQEFGGAIIENQTLIIGGHTSDIDPKHDFMLARFSLDPAPILSSINRYGTATHDGATAITADDQFYVLVGISDSLGTSTTCIKLINKANLDQVSDIYIQNEFENYPYYAILEGNYVNVAGYILDANQNKQRMLLKRKLF